MAADNDDRLPLLASDDRVYRTRLTWRTGWVFAGIATAIYLGTVVALVTTHPPDSEGRWVPLTLGAVVIGALHLFFTVRTATAAVFADDDGIRIRNPFMTARLLWEDIDRFELREEGRHPSICMVVLRDGSEFKVLGIRANHGFLYSNTAPAQDLVDELNAKLQARRRNAG